MICWPKNENIFHQELAKIRYQEIPGVKTLIGTESVLQTYNQIT